DLPVRVSDHDGQRTGRSQYRRPGYTARGAIHGRQSMAGVPLRRAAFRAAPDHDRIAYRNGNGAHHLGRLRAAGRRPRPRFRHPRRRQLLPHRLCFRRHHSDRVHRPDQRPRDRVRCATDRSLGRPAMMSLRSLPFTFAAIRTALANGVSAESVAREARRRAEAVSSDGLFTALLPLDAVLNAAGALDRKAAAGIELPLLGLPFSVKDNIHVAGMPTTCSCPALSIMPAESAPVVQRLEAAGAVLIGKNTMDQFATGLSGTRSSEPRCRNAVDPRYIPGGSSSGSAVAVARDVVAFSLGSDTGGSGRVPAACNGIVGVKPTLGLVSTRGLVYNSRFFDCVPVFARRCDEAYEVLEHLAGYDELDPFSRPDADEIDLAPLPAEPKVLAVVEPAQLKFYGDVRAQHAYGLNLETLHL